MKQKFYKKHKHRERYPLAIKGLALLMILLSFGISSVQAQTDAMRLNGSTYLESDIDGSTINNQNFTVEVWVRTTTTDDAKIINALPHHLIATISGNARICLQSGCAAGTTINDGNWHHLASSYDSGTSQWFLTVDGTRVLNDNSGPASANLSSLIQIGGVGNNFNGDIDEVRIWNTNKTEAEIAASMNSCLTGTETNLVALYNFDDSGNRLRNSVTMGDATIATGTPTYVTDGPTCTVPPAPFITTWQTTTASESITIPHDGTGYNFTVDWGDGNSETLTDSDAPFTHTYTTANTYTVEITGDFPRIYFNDGGDRLKIQSIEQWGDIAWTSMEQAFWGCSNMTYNATDAPDFSVSGGISLNQMFDECSVFNGDLSAWDMSNVTNTRAMFALCFDFNGNITGWNVSGVTNMERMFDQCTDFNQNLSSWTVSAVTNMTQMFKQATNFNQNISSWNVSAVQNMSGMFNNATAFNQDLSSWNLASITNMSSMFSNATAFNNGETTNTGANPLTWTLNTTVGAGISMQSMFNNADAFNQDISSWDVNEVTAMNNMFINTALFNNGGTALNWGAKTSKVSTMQRMFNNADAFNQDISSWDLSSLTVMREMFNGADAFNQDLSAWDVSNVQNMRSVFLDAVAFNNGGNPLTWTTTAVTDMQSIFQRATSFNQDVSSWDVSGVSKMDFAFENADAFNQDLSAWDVSNVTSLRSMFGNNDAFNQDLSAWDVSGVSDMFATFWNATAFDQSLASWDISSATNMGLLIDNCGMSTASYDATLIGWATLDAGEAQIPTSISLGASGLEYCFGETARNTLTSAPNSWSITGDALNCGDKNALDFDGNDDFVAITNPHTDFSSNEITVEFWLNLDDINEGGDGILTQGALNSDDMSTNVWLISDDGGQDGRLSFYVNDNMNWRIAETTSIIEGSGWHHIAGVADASGIRIYVDGVEQGTGAGISSNIQVNNTANLHFGKDVRYAASRRTDVAIDEVRIWNVARTEAQIQAAMNAELTTAECNLVAYYNFNQGVASGANNSPAVNTLPDESGNAHTGTLNNFTLNGATSNWVTGAPAITTVVTPAEINVQGNSNDIVNGSTTINTTIDTDFGTVSTATKTYTIQNTGGIALNISDITSNSGRFTISGAPSTVAAGGSATFNVTYNSSLVGPDMATITITNSDCDEGTYTFAVEATAVQQNALNFDGSDDYVELPSSTVSMQPDMSGTFTIEMWVKGSSSLSTSNYFYCEGNSGSNNQVFSFRAPSGKMQTYIRNNTGSVINSVTSTANVFDDSWHHIAYTYNNGTANLYIDGVKDASNFNFTPSATPLTVNRVGLGAVLRTGANGFFPGSMDEVRIWNDVRTCSEINANMNSELMGSEAGLVAYYNFNQGVAGGNNTGLTTLTDGAGSNNGTLTNFTGLGGGTTSNWVTGSTGITGIPNPQSEITVNIVSDGGTYDVGGYTAGTPVDLTYTITNTGSADLVLPASPVSVTGGDAQFTVTSQPANLTIPAGSSETFTVQFNPAVLGTTYTTNFAVAYTGCGDYTFSLTGKAINETVDGTRGNMMTFDGSDDYIDLGNNFSFERTDAFSLECWFKTNTATGLQRILANTNPSNSFRGYEIGIQDAAGTLRFFMANTYPSNAIDIRTTTNGFNDGNWHHLVVTYNGSGNASGVIIYVDGVSQPLTIDIDALTMTTISAQNLSLGRRPDGGQHLNGDVDEVRIWNDVRTENEIRENMHLTLLGSESGLVGYWQFNEDSGDAIDKITGNDGTLNGGVTRTASQVAVAGGKSKRVTVTTGSTGTDEVDLSTTNMSIDFGAGTNPNGELVVYQLNENPYTPPTGVNSTSRYWIVRNFGGNTSGLDIDEVTFQIPDHNDISSTDEASPTNFRVFKRGSAEFGAWTDTDALGTAASNTSKQITFNTSAAAGFTSFSQFIVTSNGNSGLPISLLHFNAQRANEKQVLLTWATAVEQDNAGFEIEMSADGENFQHVGFVEGAGNSSEIINYEFIINNSNAGYYRLKQVDFEGSFEYSDLRFVEGVKILRSLRIAPNPTNGKVVLSLSPSPLAPKGGTDSSTSPLGNEGLVLRLLDSKGQAILDTEGSLNQVNEHLNNILGRASKGLYFLEVQSGTERFIERIILQ